MQRRDAISALLALGSAADPLGVCAQSNPTQSKTLGILTLATAQDAERFWLPGLRAKLKALGWVEGQNLVIESAFADAKVERLAAMAEELVRKRVDVIWAFPDLAAIAAARATRTIPIVFVNVAWPVEQGLIESYGRPGRNVTGGGDLHRDRGLGQAARVPQGSRAHRDPAVVDSRFAHRTDGGWRRLPT